MIHSQSLFQSWDRLRKKCMLRFFAVVRINAVESDLEVIVTRCPPNKASEF